MNLLEKARVASRVAHSMATSSRFPLVAAWNLTYRCNLRCDYCGTWRDRTPEASTEEIFETIDRLASLGTRFVGFSGGESMLRDDIGPIIDRCAERGMNTSIQSNGTLVEEKIEEIANLTEIQFSIDGPPEVNDPIRGKGVHDAVLRAIELCQGRGMEVSLSVVLTDQNLAHVDYMLELCDRFDIGAYFQPVDLSMVRMKPTGDLHEPPVQAYRDVIDRLIDERRRGRKAVRNSVQGLEHLKTWPNPPPIKCMAELLAINIEPDGRIAVCDMYGGYEDQLVRVNGSLGKAFQSTPRPVGCDRCLSGSRVEFNLLGQPRIETLWGVWQRM